MSRIRNALSAFAARLETTAGTDPIGGSPIASDFVTGQFTIEVVRNRVANPNVFMGYDSAAPIPGSAMARITGRVPVVGSGAAGTAPEWGKLVRACAWEEVVTSSAVGAPTALSAGTTTSATLASPFVDTAGLYAGMPLLIPTESNALPQILTYASGRVATLSETFGTALNTSDTAQIPINVVYRPTSAPSTEGSLTIYAYFNGLGYVITGARGTWGLEITAGGAAFLTFTFMGCIISELITAGLPTVYVPVTRVAPIWLNGKAQLNRVAVEAQSLSFTANNTIELPDNPEAANGYSFAETTARAAQWRINPLQRTSTTPGLAGLDASGQDVAIHARWGTVAGNRFMIGCPGGAIQRTTGSRGGFSTDEITVTPSVVNTAAYLACF